MEYQKEELTTTQKVIFSVMTIFALSLVAFIIMHIKSILMLLALLIGCVLVGYVLFKISYLLFSALLLVAGMVVFIAALGWVIHFVG